MSVQVEIPTALRSFTEGASRVGVEGATVGEALGALARRFGGLQRHLFTEDGKLRSFVSVYLNDEDVRYLGRESTPVRNGDTLRIIPSIAGGTPGAVAYPSLSRLSRAPPPTGPRPLSREQLKRYSRQLLLPEVGTAGQRKLLGAKVLLVGAGGLGSPVALYLAAAGVGKLGLVDFDQVDESNLQRQILYTTSDVGTPKVEAAERRLQALNPEVSIVRHEGRLTSASAFEVLSGYDVIVDGTDNFPTRYLVNDAAVLLRKPVVYGSIYRFEGQVTVFDARAGPCYRCLYPEPPPPGLVPSCAEGGVLGVLPGIIGSLQAMETLKLLLGQGDTLLGRLVLFDGLALSFRELKVRKDPQCPICGEHPTQTKLIDYEAFCGLGEAAAPKGPEISPVELKEKLDQGAAVVLVDVREPGEFEITHLPGSKLIPRAALPDRLGELSTADDLVLVCKVGARSAQAAEFLRSMGFAKARNLRGGIDAWVREVDPSLPNY
jgi:adenylyltransferase/sulfurtransferase